MGTSSSRRWRCARMLHAALAVSMLAVVSPSITTTIVEAAPSATPWVGSGPGTVTLDSAGSVVPPQLTYNLGGGFGTSFPDHTWTLSTTAVSTITDNVPYTYTGLHAFYQVIVHLDAFVTHNGLTTTTHLINDGPVDCCTPPSGGFSYSGSHSFDVVSGDTYGFTMGGSNFDLNPTISGTLALAPPNPPYTNAVAIADNTSWTTAAPLTSAGVNGTLTQPGEVRWYKFPVQPDSQVQVDLNQLDQNFDLTMFRDIGQAFTTLTSTQDLTKLSVQFAGNAYSPSIYSPSIYSPSIYSPSIYSPSIYSPSIYSPSIYSPSIYSPSIYSPSIYSPSIYSPSIYSPSIYSPSIYSPSDAFLAAFSGAQTRSLIAVSAHDNTDAESIRTATWNNTGDFYVRVQGRNGAYSPTPFHLDLTTAGGPCATLALNSFSSTPTIAGTPGAATTVILTDSTRIGQGTTPGLTSTLDALASRTGGVLVDVSASPRINALNLQADANKACPYAKNLVAQAIRDVVNSFRGSSETLKYVVLAGGDSVIPFLRYADAAGIGPESDYVPPALASSASEASLRRNYVLGQDAYGAVDDLSLKGATIPVPDLAVGRLVETPDEIQGSVNAFLVLANGVLPTPTSSLVTGYDFLTSAADSVQSDFATGLGSAGHAETLITDQGVPTTDTTVGSPSRNKSWTATDLSNALFGSHHDLVFLAGHFSANNTLAADYKTTIATTDLDAHPTVLSNSLVISAGCHVGYNIVDADGQPGVTLGLDWAEEMAKQHATFIGGTGYQYADTDFVAYSAKLYTLLAKQLRTGSGPIAIGPALVSAKQAYLASVSSLTGIDQKALLEATFYGLPMTALNLPGTRITPASVTGITPLGVTAGTPGSQLGLKTAPFSLSPQLTSPPAKPVLDTNGDPTGAAFHWWTGPNGVQSEPGLPALPKQIADVTSTTGEVLRGVGFVSGTYADSHGVTPLTGAPTTEQNGVHTDFVSPVFFPQKLAAVNYFGALDGNGTDGRTRLITTPVQYRSDPGNIATDTERSYSQLGLQLFYSANTSTYGANTPALAAPPSISGVSDTVALDGSTVTLRARITGDPSAGIQKTWVTYTAETGPLHGSWQSLDLIQDPVDSTLWTGTFALPVGQSVAAVRYILQAANGVGLVGLDNNLGDGYTPGVAVGATVPPATVPTSITLDPVPASGVSGDNLAVGATLVGAPSGSPITFTLGSVSIVANTNAGRATATVPLQDSVGGYTLTASYGGDTTRLGSSATAAFSITKVPTSLSIAAGTAGAFTATLIRTSTGTPLPQQTVYFQVTGPTTKAVTATTDPQGQAQLAALSLLDGAYTVSAQFLGTPSTYLASSTPTANFVVDTRAPIVTGVLSPAPNAAGWNHVNVTVTWSSSDPTPSSGAPSVPAPTVVTSEGAAQVVTSGQSCDPLHNCATGSTLVSIDRTDPTITSTASPAANAAGWNNTPVTVSFQCADSLSGVATCPAPQLVSSQGTSAVSGVVQDRADNSASASRSVKVDTVAPTVAALALAPASIVVGATTRLTASVADATSGISRVEYFIGADPGVGLATPLTVTAGAISVNFGTTLAVGSYTITVRAIDVAGNRSTSTATLTVAQIGVSVSTSASRSGAIDLAGSTVSGNIAVFATPAAGTSKVVIMGFYLDDPNRTNLPYWVQLLSPYDLNGTLVSGLANMFDSRVLLNGTHTLTVELLRLNGTVERRTVSFNVNNPAPAVTQKLQVSTSATRSNPVDLQGRTLTGSVAIFVTPTTSVKSVAFWLDTVNLTTIPRSIDIAAAFDFNGTASNGQATLFNVGSLAAGQHRIAVRVTYTNGTFAILSSTFTK